MPWVGCLPADSPSLTYCTLGPDTSSTAPKKKQFKCKLLVLDINGYATLPFLILLRHIQYCTVRSYHQNCYKKIFSKKYLLFYFNRQLRWYRASDCRSLDLGFDSGIFQSRAWQVGKINSRQKHSSYATWNCSFEGQHTLKNRKRTEKPLKSFLKKKCKLKASLLRPSPTRYSSIRDSFLPLLGCFR